MVTKTVIRSTVLKAPNVISNLLLSRYFQLSSNTNPKKLKVRNKLLLFVEILNLVNLPYRQIIQLLHIRHLFILTYMSSSVLLKGKFGSRFEIKQIILSTEIDIFEFSRNICIKKLMSQFGQSREAAIYQIGNKLTESKKIIFYLHNLNQKDFLIFYKSFVDNNLLNKNVDIRKLGLQVSNILILKGYFSIAEQVEIHSKTSYDKQLSRSTGLRNESSYLTAIGHIALMGYLVMAKRVGMLADKPVNFLMSKNKVSNKLFANLIIQEASNVGMVVHTSFDPMSQEPDLELFPNKFNSYDIARYVYSEVFRSYWKKYNKPLLNLKDVNSSFVELGRDVLTRNGITNHNRLVGFHVREDQNFSRSNRNSKFTNYIKSILWLENQGYTVVRLGHSVEKTNSRIGKSSLNVANLELNSEELDAVNIFVWANSKFFVGNLSGGTFPPGLFGTPTIYTDIFPYTHFTVPGILDSALPKKLFCLNSQKLLTLDDTFSDRFTNLQVEDPLRLAIKGYSLLGRNSDEILRAIILFEKKLGTGYTDTLHAKVRNLDNSVSKLLEFKAKLLFY